MKKSYLTELRIKVTRHVLKLLRYEPACIYVPLGSSLRLIIDGDVELRADNCGMGPLILMNGDVTIEMGTLTGGEFRVASVEETARFATDKARAAAVTFRDGEET